MAKTILILVFIILAVSAFSTGIYMLIYRNMISRRITEGNSAEKKSLKMISPLSFFMIVFFSILLIYILGACLISFTLVGEAPDIPNGDNIINLCDEKGFVSLIDEDEQIPGYHLVSRTSGNFEFVVYIREGESSDGFPDVLMHTKYIGNLDAMIDTEILLSPLMSDADTDNVSHKNISNTNETWFSINNPGSLYSHVLISCWASDKEEYKLAQKNNGSPDCEFGSFQVRLK